MTNKAVGLNDGTCRNILWRISLYIFYRLACFCTNFYGISALDGYWYSAVIRRIIYKFLNVCPFDCAALVFIGKVGIPLTSLTTQVRWLSLPNLTVLSRSAIVV